MSLKQYTAVIVLCISGYVVTGCSDDNNMVGSGIQPDEDFATVYSDTFQLKASTVKVDSLYAKTPGGLLGEIYDPLYGYLKADYLCQFYCEEEYTFRETPREGKVDSMDLYIEFHQYAGDPLASIQVYAYPVNKPLDKQYYTFVNPEEYADMQHPLSNATYTIASTFVDSIVDDKGVLRPQHIIRLRLPAELGQRFYDETIHNPSSFSTQEAFNQFFPGIYITTSYGSGSVVKVVDTYMAIAYNYLTESSSGAIDSAVVAYEGFGTTKEVIQLNRMESHNEAQLLTENDEYTYLKTPAGIFTRIVVPTKEIASTVEGRILNRFILNLKYMPQEDWMYSFTPPTQLLLVPEDSLSTFFQHNSIENNVTTYLSVSSSNDTPTSTSAGYDPLTRTYYFNNIVNLLSYHIQNNPEEDLRLLVVPITREYSTIAIDYYTDNYMTTGLSHYFMPAGAKLRKDEESMKIELISSRFANK